MTEVVFNLQFVVPLILRISGQKVRFWHRCAQNAYFFSYVDAVCFILLALLPLCKLCQTLDGAVFFLALIHIKY